MGMRYFAGFSAISLLFSLPIAIAQATPPSDLSPETAIALASTPVPEAGAMHFVPNPAPISCEGTVEVQRQATIVGRQIRIGQVLRWSDSDAAQFATIADLVIDQFDGTGNRTVTLEEIRSTLSGAGVNLGVIRFSGPTVCLVTKSEALELPAALADNRVVVRQWAEKSGKSLASTASTTETAQPAITAMAPADPVDAGLPPVPTLKDLLTRDVSERLNLPVEQLQMTFDPRDRALLKLAEPSFKFSIEPRRVRDLGRVSWDVTVLSGENQQKTTVSAEARVWQRELIMTSAVNFRQVLLDDDISERRVLVDHVSYDPLLTRKQVVGQQAARDLKPGVVLTSRMIDPVPLARQGQYVTITLVQGGVQLTTVCRAMESGTYGQTIKVQNEQTREVLNVTLNGYQTATLGSAPDVNTTQP